MFQSSRRSRQGFTLIELVVVIAILGILTTITLTHIYQYYLRNTTDIDHTQPRNQVIDVPLQRAKLVEAPTLASEQNAAVAEYYSTEGSRPISQKQAGIEQAIRAYKNAHQDDDDSAYEDSDLAKESSKIVREHIGSVEVDPNLSATITVGSEE